MTSKIWGTQKKRSRGPEMESFNREGHWKRVIPVKQENWPIIEHWATEFKFRLIATKGRRRLYRRGHEDGMYRMFLDIRHDPTEIHIKAWIEPSFRARLLWLFQIGPILPVFPSGLAAVFIRRRVCHEFNVLLDRFKQSPIVDSDGFHIADLDVTTLSAAAAFFAPISALLIGAGLRFDWTPDLARTLLQAIGSSLAILFVFGFALLAIHHWIFVKGLKPLGIRIASASTVFGIFTVASILLLSHTRTDMARDKIAFHCIQKFNDALCEDAVQSLPQARELVLEPLNSVQRKLFQ